MPAQFTTVRDLFVKFLNFVKVLRMASQLKERTAAPNRYLIHQHLRIANAAERALSTTLPENVPIRSSFHVDRLPMPMTAEATYAGGGERLLLTSV